MPAITLPANIIGPEVSSDRFTFADGAFVAELSDFDGSILGRPLYSDACDEGFVIRSARTGNAVAFYRSEDEHDAEGELVAVHYEAVGAPWRVVLFND